MANEIESKNFRRMARANCYRYGCLYVHTDNDVALDKHNFPSYRTSENGSAMEKFLTLMQGIGVNAGSNDPTQKLPRTLPVVQWSGDSFETSIGLNGTMYFLDYNDYTSTKSALKSMLVQQGWTVTRDGTITSYAPTMQGARTLYSDDPIDAAGMAMMTNALQHTTAELEILKGLMTQDVKSYASGKARIQAREEGEKLGLAGFGVIQNMKAGYEAYSANTAAGIIGQWQIAGHPIELLIDGAIERKSINGVLTSAEFTEGAYVVDNTSNGIVYPTQMEVSIEITNLYGALLTTMTVRK